MVAVLQTHRTEQQTRGDTIEKRRQTVSRIWDSIEGFAVFLLLFPLPVPWYWSDALSQHVLIPTLEMAVGT